MHDFRIWGRVHDSQNHLCLTLETPSYFQKSEKTVIIFENMIWGNIKISWLQVFEQMEKAGPTIMTICLINSWRSWIWDQYLPESMKWTFLKILNVWSIPSRKHEWAFLKILNVGSISQDEWNGDFGNFDERNVIIWKLFCIFNCRCPNIWILL